MRINSQNPTGDSPGKNETGTSGSPEPDCPEIIRKFHQSRISSSTPNPSESSNEQKTTGPKTQRLVQRKTGLRGLSIAPSRMPQSIRRRNTLADLSERDAEIPYVKTELGIRDLVCSLMEREDRMYEEHLNRLIDLEYRIDDLETLLHNRSGNSNDRRVSS